MVGMGVPFIICWENASRLRLTCTSLKDAARSTGPISDRDTVRPRCIRFGADRAVNRTASSAGFFRISPSGDRVNPFGRRGNDRRADDAAPVPLGKLAGVGQHRHAAHRVADQHHDPPRRHHFSTVSRSLPSWVSV